MCVQVLSTFELDELSVVAVGAGAQHSIVAAGDALFVWGNNAHGQLGCGEVHEKPVCAPMMLRWLENVTVTQLTCGDHHSIVVTNQSTVYAWGCNTHGQLGLGDLKLRSRPVRVDRLWGIPIVNVAAGGEHSLAVTTNGMLFTWGSNKHGQLGHPYNVEEAEEIHKRCAASLLAALAVPHSQLCSQLSAPSHIATRKHHCQQWRIHSTGAHSSRFVKAGGRHRCARTRGPSSTSGS